MVIDALDRQGINIKNIALPEAQMVNYLFDSDKEIGDKDWEGIIGSFDENTISRTPGTLMAAKLLNPNRFNDFNLGPKDIQRLKAEIADKYGDNNWVEFAINAMALKVLSPQDFDINLGDEIVENMLDTLITIQHEEPHKWMRTLEYAFAIKVVSPNIDILPYISESAWGRINAQLEEWPRGSIGFTDWAMYIRFLDPSRFSKIKPGDKDWHDMKNTLEKNRNPLDWAQFVKQALAMRVLAAEGVQISDIGEIIISKPKKIGFEEAQPALPSMRKF